MKVYLDDSSENINIVQSVASASTMISSLAIEAKQYILSKFPNHFFKHVYIDTAQTVSQQYRNDKYNKTANKIPYPSMGISPEISLDDPIGNMQKALHMSSPNIYLRRDVNRSYKKILVDPDEKFALYYTSDYITTNFNFKLVTNSFIQNADMAFYLQSRFQKDFFQFLNNKSIQSEIPKTFIRIISDIKQWNLNDPNEMDELRLYLIGTSKTPETIQKRTSLQTGKQCFFLNEKQNLLTLLTDLDCPSSVNRDSQVESEYTITFRLQISAWLPNAYIMVIDKTKFRDSVSQETVEDFDSYEITENGIVSTAVFSKALGKKETILFYDSGENEQIGHLIFEDSFFYDIEKDIPEVMLLKRLSPELKKIFSYATETLNIDPTSLFYIKVIRSGGSDDGSVVEINYNTLSVKLKKNGLKDTDVKICVYINRLLYESVKIAMEKDVDFFNSNCLTTIIANIAGKSVNLVVNSFVNDRELRSSDIEKSLRVETSYGTGYIALLPDDNENDAYKVCIGYDNNGEAIIRQIKTKS